MAVLERIAHGIKAGVVGGVAMLGLFAAASMFSRHGWWEVPNLLGSTFYHARAFYMGPGVATLAGGALHLTVSGCIGAAFVLACGNVRSRHRLILLGTLFALTWFFAANVLLWPRINPLVASYWPEPAAVLSHVLFGVCLGYGAAVGAHSEAGDLGANGPSDAVDL